MPAACKNDPVVEQDPLLFQLMTEVGIVAQLSQNRAAALLAPDLNMSQFIVLNHFVRVGGESSLTQLARAMEVTKGAMTNTVSRLEHKGYVAIRPDPQDGRSKLVRLTPAGRAARGRAVARLGESLAPLAAALSDQELTAVLQSLRTARIWFDRTR
ncbi:MAG: MarR family winged helix-turn-helix transcriptional regulator [Gemmatimonas sp.]|jgi:DNA-binding MarR family transcriptional regulator|uniref:MarR family winged helix-turn-helix transcriptional regulator n=1 Tax=Gemmatimonas sp. TaxID=1962908 RepID=UPI0022C7BEDA|nr:MarR family transcriptional regulator [Gemmatimonas sp.]MCA2995549.1 winged helix DNA-binding protein [Gemmatimonas sp.]MCE2954965.1 MarR family transcriptional regulator [Gemmatimonas sp.]MCZ8011432.1 MarR family transcriptional regulator [Gemmatimonas sp.]MCZ8267713.1 MarR family transcriptional regulator [Gemmatimonas sp.]